MESSFIFFISFVMYLSKPDREQNYKKKKKLSGMLPPYMLQKGIFEGKNFSANLELKLRVYYRPVSRLTYLVQAIASLRKKGERHYVRGLTYFKRFSERITLIQVDEFFFI